MINEVSKQRCVTSQDVLRDLLFSACRECGGSGVELRHEMKSEGAETEVTQENQVKTRTVFHQPL
jgi:hypothetical protein